MSRLEWDRLSVYPYDSCNIQELLCKLYNELQRLKEAGVVFDPKDWQDKIDTTNKHLHDLAEKHRTDIEKLTKDIEMLKKRELSFDMFPDIKGDGVTDDSDAIEKAFDWAKKNKITTMYVPCGNYYVTKPLRTYTIKVVGFCKPDIPDEDFRRSAIPSAYTKQMFDEYIKRCKGSNFCSDQEISIFSDGLTAENIGIIGSMGKKHQHGIGQLWGGEGQQIKIQGVAIRNVGGNGIDAPYGLIEPHIIGCTIRANGRHGIYIGKDKGPINQDNGTNQPYTGETNNIVIERNDLNNNMGSSIYLDVSGRSFYIRNNSMERCGWYDRPEGLGKYPDRIEDVQFCCVAFLGSENKAWATGNFVFEENYSEISQGFLYLRANDTVCNQVVVKNNFFISGRQDKPCQAVDIDGMYVSGVNVWGNKMVTTNYPLLKTGKNVYAVVTDCTYENKGYLDMNFTFRSNLNTGNPINHFYTCGSQQVGKNVSCEIVGLNGTNNDANTLITFPAGTLTDAKWGLHIEQDGRGSDVIGMAFLFGENFLGYVTDVSTANNAFTVSRPIAVVQTLASIGQTKISSFKEVGGLFMMGGQGNIFKCMPDEAGGLTTIRLN